MHLPASYRASRSAKHIRFAADVEPDNGTFRVELVSKPPVPIVPFLRWPFWPVSMLYAGIYLNVGLFEFTYYFGKLAIHPALVAFSAALFSVFLFVGVAYVPAVFGAEEGGGTLADLSNLFLGRWPTYILKYGLYAAWLVSWLLSSAFYAARYLRLGLVRQDGFSLITELIITLLWLAVIAASVGRHCPYSLPVRPALS